MERTLNNKKHSSQLFRLKTKINYKKEMLQKLSFIKENIFSKTKFDIKQYLDKAKTLYVFNSLEHNEKNISTKSTDNLSKYNETNKFKINSNVPNSKKPKLNLPSLSMKISRYSISNIYTPKINYFGINTNYNLNVIKKPNLKINTRYNHLTDNNSENYINVIKAIKLIKSKEKNFDFKSYLNKTKNIIDKKNALIAIDSDKIVKNYNKSKKIKEAKDIPISTFITQRKEISKNNLMIKLMNNESNKLQKKEKIMTKELKIDIKNIEFEEKKLDEYTNNQKFECKQIEMTLVDLISKHERLIKEEQELILDIKVKEFEIYKLLININLYRYFAKFSNTILEGDPSRFEKQILPDYHEFDKIDLEPIINEVIKNYSDIKIDRGSKVDKKHPVKMNRKDSKKEFTNIIKYKEEGYFLNNPEFLYHKYNEIEGNILRLLTTKEKLIMKKIKREKYNNEALSYLIDRCKDLQNEYNILYELYKLEEKKFQNDMNDKGNSHIDIDLSETNYFIKELYLCAIEVLEDPLLKLCKLNQKSFVKSNLDINKNINFEGLVKYGKYFLDNFECNFNLLLKEINDERKEDRKTFEKVIKDIKIFYKIERQKLFEKNLKNENEIKMMEIFDKQNVIKIIPRRDEPPFYKSKKKKIEIDYDTIRKEEDKELIEYN